MSDQARENASDDDHPDDQSSESQRVKVTDRRMFTPDGQLRDEYSFLAEAEEPKQEAPSGGEAEPPAAASPVSAPESVASPGTGAAAKPPPEPPGGAAAGGGRPLEMDLGPSPAGEPGFVDLLSILAEPVAIYLGDVELPDGRSAENLDAARLHIDLLDVLREKTVGNLSSQEAAVLEDLLYRLRLRYVQKRG